MFHIVSDKLRGLKLNFPSIEGVFSTLQIMLKIAITLRCPNSKVPSSDHNLDPLNSEIQV